MNSATSSHTYKHLSILNLVFPILGVGLFFLDGYGVYSAFTDGGYIMWQGVVMGSMGVGISLCYIFSPTLKHLSGFVALALSFTFAVAHTLYNQHSLELLIYGLIFSLAIFLVPSFILVYAWIPANRVKFAGSLEIQLNRTGIITVIGIVILIILVLLVLFGLGFSM